MHWPSYQYCTICTSFIETPVLGAVTFKENDQACTNIDIPGKELPSNYQIEIESNSVEKEEPSIARVVNGMVVPLDGLG